MWDDETILLMDRQIREIKELKSALNQLTQQVRRDVDFYNQVIQGLRSGELPWDRVQIMETGQLKILDEAPAMPEAISIPCNPEIADSIAKSKNGKKETADVT
jgi:FtsZ-binding cell division protein ZapB